MIANRETMQIQQELRTTRRSPRAKPSVTSESEQMITIVTPDYGVRIRAYRKEHFFSEGKSHAKMAKASRGNFGKSCLERFESGVKPSLEEARVLQRVYDGLDLLEEAPRSQSTRSELEKILERNGIEDIEQGNFETDYFAFLEPLYLESKNILLTANENSREIESDGTWNGIRKWDASVPCTSNGCNGYLPLTPVSNTKDFYNDTIVMIREWVHSKFNSIPKDEFPEEFVAEGETIDAAKTRILDNWEHFLSHDETGIVNFKNQSVNTYNVRGSFRTLIWNNSEEALFGDFKLDLYDFARDVGGDFSYPSRGAFTDLELRAIHASGDKKAAKIAHRLNICDDRARIPTCSQCGTTRWGLPKTTFILEENHFDRISEIATKTVLESLVGSPARLNSNHFVARDPSGKKKMISTSGEIMKVTRKEIKQQLSDAVGVCLDLFGTFELPGPNGPLTMHAMDNISSKIYSATNTDVVGELAKQLKQLKPILEFLDEESPYLAQDEWAGSNAAQILHAFGAKAHLFETRRSKNLVYSNGDAPKHELNMLTLATSLSKAVGETFSSVGEDGSVENILEQYLRGDTNLPMLCPPREHTSFGDGGYLSKSMRLRYPMISNDVKESMLGHRRLDLSNRAIQTLNFLQETEWTANAKVMNIAVDLLKSMVQENILEHLDAVEKEDSDNQKYLAFRLTAQPKVTQNQVHAWMKTGAFIEQHFSDSSSEMSFYHPWTFEWRGRMMTATTILSPQNDDLSRGVLRFAQPQPLDEHGWAWLQRHAAALMRDREINTIPALQHLGEEWGEIQTLLSDKTWDAYDQATAKPAFRQAINAIANSPMDTFDAWGKGDIFSAKCEGFQRLSACVTLSDAYAAGGVGAEVNLPISHDASSSIYQHTSALVQDREMAESVNVLPQKNEKPADVYAEIMADVKSRWELKGNPLTDLGMSSEASARLSQTLLNRKFSKKPVMTRGYGATQYGITGSFLTHNGKTKGMFGAMIFADKKTNKEIPESADRNSMKKSEAWWRPTAHPASLLGPALIGKVELALHFPIAQTIVDEIDKSMSKILPGMGLIGEFFEGEADDFLEQCKRDFEGGEADFHPPHIETSWKLADGCKVQNLKLASNELESITSWQSNLSSSEEREKARTHIDQILQSLGYSSIFQSDGKINTSELRAIFDVPDEKENGKPLRGRISFLIEQHGRESEHKDALVKALKIEEALRLRSTYTRRTLGTSRNHSGEQRGLSPNFIHSHDACHMRLVLEKLQTLGITDVWSVHDAFGAHPNHMSNLRKFAVASFVDTHQANTLAQINKARFDALIKPTMDIEEVARIDMNGPVSKYLIS